MAIAEDLAEFERSLNQLITKYEQYFIGLEKREPLQLRKDVETIIKKYSNVPINNTMYKFRYNSLVARFSTYSQQWCRISQLIEDGRYSRDRFKMELRHTLGRMDAPAGGGAASGEPADLDKLYAEYLDARKSCNLSVEKVTREMVAESIAKQKPMLEKKYGAKNLNFRVVIENGKPKIKAGIKKSA